MKSEVPSDAPKRREDLKGVLLNPESIGAEKTFPAEEEMIASKVGNEFSHICSDSNKPQRDLSSNGPEEDKSLVVRKKRKSQQAGPSYAQSCEVKENQRLLELRLEPQSNEDNDSSFSDCVSSPSSSSHFGDSDTMTSDEDKDMPRRFSPAGVNAASRTPNARAQKWPRPQTESVPTLLMKRPCYQVSGLRRSMHRKRIVKNVSTQRTQKQKERILMQKKKREVLARQKYALLPSSSSSSENDLSSDSASSSSTEGEDDIFVSPGENHQNGTTLVTGTIDEDVVVIEASSTPQVPANEEINVTSTDSEVEIVTVDETYRYFDTKQLLRRKLNRACRERGAGEEHTAGLVDYERDLMEYLGPEALQGIVGAIDTVLPIPPGADPRTSPEGPRTPEPDQLAGPTLREQSTSPLSDDATSPCQPGPSRRRTDAAGELGSPSPPMPSQDGFVLLTTVDPTEYMQTAASHTPVPTLPPGPGDVRSDIAMVAAEMRAQATAAAQRAEREEECQHPRNETRLVEAIREYMGRTQETLARLVADNSRFLDQMQQLAGGHLHANPDPLFPLQHGRHAQRDEGSGDDE